MGAVGDVGTMVKLTTTNYEFWKPRMEDILFSRDLYDPLEDGGIKPDDMDEKKWVRMNRKTIGLVRQFIDESVFYHFAHETSAYSMWKKLEAMYERKHAQNKTYLIKQLVNLKYRQGSSISEHLSIFQGILNQLTAVGLKFDDEMQALFLLGSLPDSFETLVVSLSNSAPDSILTMDMVKNSLFNEETRRKDQVAESSQALAIESRGRQRDKGFSKDRYKESRGRSQARDLRKCYYCHKPGHIERNCFEKQRDEKDGKRANQRSHDDDNDMTAIVYSGDDVIVLSCEEHECEGMATSDVEWVIDTAASFHATPNKEFFSTYKSGDFVTVKMGNSSQSKIVGIGDVFVEMDVGRTLTLKDVRHVPDLRLSLISGIALDRDGYASCFDNGMWTLVKESMVVGEGAVRGNLYRTRGSVCCAGHTVTEDGSLSDVVTQKTVSR